MAFFFFLPVLSEAKFPADVSLLDFKYGVVRDVPIPSLCSPRSQQDFNSVPRSRAASSKRCWSSFVRNSLRTYYLAHENGYQALVSDACAE